TADSTGTCCDTQQTRDTHHEFFGREEAVWSLLDGRIKNYFGANISNYWESTQGPFDPVSNITTGDRIKFDWRSVTEVAAGQNLVVGLEREDSRLDTTGFSAERGNERGVDEWQWNLAKRFFLPANIREHDTDSFAGHMPCPIAPAVIGR